MSGQWTVDPTGRHQERYQDGGVWTARVRDRGVENDDAIGLATLSAAAPAPTSTFGRIEPTSAPKPVDPGPVGPPGVTDPTLVTPIFIPPEMPPEAAGATETAAVADDPATSSRRTILIGAGVAVVVLLVAVAVALFATGGSDEAAVKAPKEAKPVNPTVPLRAGEAAVTDSLVNFKNATTLAGVDDAAVQALVGIAAIDDQAKDVARIKSPAAQDATEKALSHEREILVALGGLKGYTGENLQQWVLLSVTAERSTDALQVQLDRLSELGVYTPKAKLVDEVGTTRSTVDGNLRAIDTKLTAWKTETDRIKASKVAELSTLDSYASGVRAQVSRYSSLRKTMQEFVDRVDTVGVTFEEAYTALGDAGSQRSAVRSNLAGMSPPAAVAATHNGLLSVLDTAVSAVSDATDGVRQFQSTSYYDSSYYCDYEYEYYECDTSYRVYYKDTPGWQTFVSKSDSITSTYDDALRAWEGAVASEEARINAIPLPPKPAV